ncbi:MAG: DUF2254 domain-containing protein [Saprospiraceae bacterium]|nr:DUF2254 domain-containing protein [Bacteroidia bacterium]NNE14585.1 DUF2254 domain-containing protein [Saprospiraceae bacterium]NNL92628.1 DUF2254 domain-containing protein [Saprospiraceae bacterium]
MLSIIKNSLISLYHKLISSIAFYPSIILLGFMLLVGFMLSIEDNSSTKWLIENAPYLVINNADTARSILSTMIGGLISLMVFSFSMVMMLLNQASSNFSPRLLPGLISDKRNQFVLGIYLGTIVYNIIVLMTVLPDGNEYTLNGFSILVGMILGMSCLIAFIYFIHTVSSGIQINNILKSIFSTTKKRLLHVLEQEKQTTQSDVSNDGWQTIKSTDAGYYQGVNLEGLLDICQEKEINLKVFPSNGDYLLPNVNLFAISKKLDEDEIKVFSSYFIFADSREISENYTIGIKQITEVGIKAMSPGINDPGTAVITIDYLTELLALRMKLGEIEIYQKDNENFTVQLCPKSFDDLIYELLAAYRQYCKHDMVLMDKLVSMLNYLLKQPATDDSYHETLRNQVKIICEDIENYVSNSSDRKRLSAQIQQ